MVIFYENALNKGKRNKDISLECNKIVRGLIKICSKFCLLEIKRKCEKRIKRCLRLKIISFLKNDKQRDDWKLSFSEQVVRIEYIIKS